MSTIINRITRYPIISAALLVWGFWLIMMSVGDHWHFFSTNWFMSVVMMFGSFIAGSTSVGGGAVAFPVMTLGFSIEPNVARDFALMIQAFGMSAAAFTIFCSRTPVEWRAVLFSSIGGVAGIIVGIEVLSPLLPSAYIKIFFTSFWLSFAIILYIANRSREPIQHAPIFTAKTKILFLVVGFIGGVVSGLTGSGLDIVVFVLLVLGLNICEKVATPTSVILMATNAVVGFVWKGMFGSPLATEAWGYWYVCVPIVVIGAPLGALFIRGRSRFFIANFLYCAIITQYFLALMIIPQTVNLFVFHLTSIVLGILLFGYIAFSGRSGTPVKSVLYNHFSKFSNDLKRK